MRSCQKTFWTIRTVESMALIRARSSGRLMPALTSWNVSTFSISVVQDEAEFNCFVLCTVVLPALRKMPCGRETYLMSCLKIVSSVQHLGNNHLKQPKGSFL